MAERYGYFLTMDENQLSEAKDLLTGIPKGMERAITTAINITLRKIQVSASREITAEYNLPSREVKSTLSYKKANFTTLTGRMNSISSRFALAKFSRGSLENKISDGHKKKKINLKIKKATPKTLTHSNPNYEGTPFVQRMKTGHVGIFQRRIGSRGIAELRTITVPQMLQAEEVSGDVLNEGSEILGTEFTRQVTRIYKGFY